MTAPVRQDPEAEAKGVHAARTARRPELKALTGVRAIAAIAVVVHHIELPPGAPEWADRVALHGYIGVPLFFMLSGFVLAYNYPVLHSTRDVVRFYIARMARVLPVYYAVLFYLIIFREAEGKHQFAVERLLLVIQTWSGDLRIGSQIYNGPAWSINVEMFLYLLFPLLIPIVALLARKGTGWLVGLAALAFAVQVALCLWFAATGWADLEASDPASGHRWLYRNPLTRIPDFLVGMSLAFIWVRGVTIRPWMATVIEILGVAYVLISMVIRPLSGDGSGFWRVASFGAMWTVPFAVLLLVLATEAGPLGRLCATGPMLTLGRASFATYLTHRPFLEYLGKDAVETSSLIPGLMLVVLLTGFCLIIGEGMHRYVEVPCQRWVMKLAPKKTSAPH